MSDYSVFFAGCVSAEVFLANGLIYRIRLSYLKVKLTLVLALGLVSSTSFIATLVEPLALIEGSTGYYCYWCMRLLLLEMMAAPSSIAKAARSILPLVL
jgi:hypothetical protein